MTNPLARLSQHGLSVWLDFLSRSLIGGGELRGLIARDDLRGVTSNPSIFEKAIGHSDEYDSDLTAFLKEDDYNVETIYEHLVIGDIRHAADELRPVYDRLEGRDGFVSLEVSPYLAMSTEATIEEARRLWSEVQRPNLLVKVPGTKPGVPAIRTLIGEGINVNVTLLFGIDAYQAVANAYMDGLETALTKGRDIGRIASVASFFVSRIDVAVEKIVDERLKTATGAEAEQLRGLLGKVAIANAKLAYERYQAVIAGGRWRKLAERGARSQRLLWASTGTKSKSLPDTLYVDQLIGRDTVNTMPPATMDAFRDHGTRRRYAGDRFGRRARGDGDDASARHFARRDYRQAGGRGRAALLGFGGQAVRRGGAQANRTARRQDAAANDHARRQGIGAGGRGGDRALAP